MAENERESKGWLERPLAIVTIAAAIATALSSVSSWFQLSASRQQLAAMKFDQRPWISLKLSPGGPISHDEYGWVYPFNYKIENVGKSPALHVNFFAKLVPLAQPFDRDPGRHGWILKPSEPSDETVKQVCSGASSAVNDGFGNVLFPNEQEGNSTVVRSDVKVSGYYPGFVVVACATYSFSGESASHETMRAYELTAHAFAQSTIHLDPPDQVAEDVVFTPLPIHGSIAD